jgi:hypothetical protein
MIFVQVKIDNLKQCSNKKLSAIICKANKSHWGFFSDVNVFIFVGGDT